MEYYNNMTAKRIRLSLQIKAIIMIINLSLFHVIRLKSGVCLKETSSHKVSSDHV